MPRTIQITLHPTRTDAVLSSLERLDGVVGIQVQRGISLKPPGDVVSAQLTGTALLQLMRLLDQQGIGRDGSSMTLSIPSAIISASSAELLARDESEATWEEMETMIGNESNMTPNGLATMLLSGILATLGIASNALHLVIAAAIIVPGFEPISRIALGLVTGSPAWRRGLSHTALGYLVLAAGAVLTTWLLAALGKSPISGEHSYLPVGALATYWTSPTLASVLASAVAAVAGAILIAAQRSVLTGGVMIALALVPSATIATMALATGEGMLAIKSLLRWLLEVGLVAGLSGLIFYWKRLHVQRRKMLL